MIRVHVLTEGFVSPNGRAFLFPLIVHRRALREAGVHLGFFVALCEALYDCDVLLIDSKFHKSRWIPDKEGILDEFLLFKKLVDRVCYFDTTDSTGQIQTELLPIVDSYYKNQILRDRTLYLRPMYGHRIYADYYHRSRGVADAEPEYSTPVDDPALLHKLAVSWNSGLADYSLLGPARMGLYQRLPIAALLRFPQNIASPSMERPIDVQCRMGFRYHRASIAFQRREIAQRLAGHITTDKIPRRKFLEEMASSKIVISPFGFGEITLKDFEVFLTGGLLLKPDMGHLDTWPDLFRAGETMICHDWDLTDLESVIDEAMANYPKYRQIAETAQIEYRRHRDRRTGEDAFVRRFTEIVVRTPRSTNGALIESGVAEAG